MDELVVYGVMFTSFILGWIGCEAYQFWREGQRRKDGTRKG
ncbi:hypothetical protein [Sulfurimonas sp.]